MKRFFRKGMTLFVVLIFSAVASLSAFASDKIDYVLDEKGTKVYIPLTYRAQQVFSPSGDGNELNNPQDMCLGAKGTAYENHMFIADTDNNRVVILDPNGQVVRTIKEADGKALSRPSGITVKSENDIYISDTGNARILHMTMQGEYIEAFVKPESDMLEKDMVFDVSKIGVTDGGLIYVMRGANFMMIDAKNQFQGMVGSTRVVYSLAFMMMRIFASQEQLEYYVSPEPAAYTSFDLSEDGLIYATVEDATEQIQIINGNGDNIYQKKFFGEQSVNSDGSIQQPNFVDITVNGNGIISALEKNSASIYQYDQQGNLLTVFGGKGDTKGFFTAPSAVVSTDDNRIYVLDSSRGDVTVFYPTSFIQNVLQAAQYYTDGRYQEAHDKWKEVNQIDAGYPLANEGIALALYKSGKAQESLYYYTLAKAKGGYSNAFDDIRYDFFRQNFIYVVLVIVLLCVGLFFLVRLLYRLSGKYLREYFYEQEDKR